MSIQPPPYERDLRSQPRRKDAARRLLHVTAAQFQAQRDDPAANLARGVRIVREAAGAGADLVLFPELWSTGYAVPIRTDLALPVDGPWVEAFRETARELGVGIAITLLATSPDGPTNSVLVLDRDGNDVLRYDKVHRAGTAEAALTAGDRFVVGVFDDITIGAMICFDREFPESARQLMLAGAEVVLVPNASSWNPARAHQLEARAFENMQVVCLANYPGDGWGQSSAYSPIVFGPDGRWRDPLIARADGTEQLVHFRFDLDALRDWRDREVWGARYRRPETYRL